MRERFSRARPRSGRAEEKDKWFLGLDYLLFVFIVGFGAIFTMVLGVGTESPLTQVVVFQMIFVLLGLMAFLFANIYPTFNIRTGFPDEKDISNMFRWFLILFPILLIMTTFLTVTLQSVAVSPNMQTALTSAIVEEALFAAGAGTLLYNVILYILEETVGKSETVKIVTEISAAIGIAILFAVTHVGAYGFVFRFMLILFLNRLIYQIAYYRTKNIMLPTLMHIANNFLVFALSILIV